MCVELSVCVRESELIAQAPSGPLVCDKSEVCHGVDTGMCKKAQVAGLPL